MYCTIKVLQTEYGYRFFLPKKWRNKVYERRRKITEAFDLSKIEEKMWPEWDIWLEKLHLRSLYEYDRSLNWVEENKSCEFYMDIGQNRKCHYFCLHFAIENRLLEELMNPMYPFLYFSSSNDLYDD